MIYNVNFKKAKRNYMTLTFDDENEKGEEYERKIHVSMPNKRTFDMLMNIKQVLEIEKEEESEETADSIEKDRKMIDILYQLMATVLSNNLNKEKIEKEWVEEQMTIDEIQIFLTEYMKFCNQGTNDPN